VPHVHLRAGIEGQAVGRLTCELGVDGFAVGVEVDPGLETEARDPDDGGRHRVVRRLVGEIEIVRPNEQVAEMGDRTEEAHHPVVRRMLVDLVRMPDLLHPAVLEYDDFVGDLHGLLLIVGDDHRCHVHLVVQTAQPGPQLLAYLCIEGSERFVKQQHPRLDGERTRQRHSLPLSAGKLCRVAGLELLEVDEFEQLVDLGFRLGLSCLADPQPERHIVVDGHVLERRVVLKDEADLAPLRRQVRRIAVFDLDRSAVSGIEAGDHSQQSRLAAATWPEQCSERAGGNVDADIVERLELRKRLRHIADGDAHCFSQLMRRSGCENVASC
jgi:hypothetical protein